MRGNYNDLRRGRGTERIIDRYYKDKIVEMVQEGKDVPSIQQLLKIDQEAFNKYYKSLLREQRIQ